MRIASINRDNLASIVTALLLILSLALWQFSSSGVVRGGGGDDDGSGIGGTGRIGTTNGESGFGGTGLKPFLGVNSNQEVQILQAPALLETAITETRRAEFAVTIPVPEVPLNNIARVTRETELTSSSAAIDISEAIQTTLDSNALYFEQLKAFIESPVEVGMTDLDGTRASTDANTTTNWTAVSKLLSQKDSASDSEAGATQLATAEIDDATAPLARPEPLQRPQLPPVQRVSPLQRAAILPPRVQPMRL